jgi:hypothetical protein
MGHLGRPRLDGDLRRVRLAELAMARELRWWLAAALVACGIIGVAYVPPRGVAPEIGSRNRRPAPTAARAQANALANEWRAADLALRLAQYRRQLEPELVRRRETDQPGPALLIDAPDTLPVGTREVVRSVLDTVWRQLGLGAGKVAVGVVVDFWRPGGTGTAETPKRPHDGGYLLPDSTDRATCIALIPAWYWGRVLAAGAQARHRQAEEWVRSGLGWCAFFAAYGAPGKAVRRWLAKRNYDLARFPAWDRDWPERPEYSWLVMNPNTRRWAWHSVYAHPIAAIACLGGRATGCRAAVLAGSGGSYDDTLPRLFRTDRWWWRGERLPYGSRYLGDVAREVGHDRFLRFWNSGEPVDTALTAALRMPVGEWTERWQRRHAPRLPLGAAAPLPAVALGVLLAGVAVLGVALGAARRQVE